MVSYDDTSNTMDVWVMKNESWSTIWTISPTRRLTKPIWFKKNGDIAVTFGSDVVIYHGKNKLRQSRADMLVDKYVSIAYVESLV